MDAVDAQLSLAANCHDRGDLRTAIGGYRRAATLAPGRLEAIGSIGLIATELGLGHAAGWLGRALAVDPTSIAALHNFALARRDARAEEAGRVLRRLLALSPGHLEGTCLLAQIGAAADDLIASRTRLYRALALDRQSVTALLAIGGILKRLFEAGTADRAVHAAVCLAPGSVGTLNAAGASAFADGKDNEAATFYRRGLAVEGAHPALLGNLGRVTLRLGRYSEAARHLRRAITKKPESADLLASLAFSLTFLRDERGAVVLCRRSTALSVLAALPRVIRAAIDRSAGRLTVAALECRWALVSEPGLAEAHMTLGSANQDFGALVSAIVHYRRALASKRNYVDAERNLLYALLHLPGTSEDDVFEAAVSFARRHEPPPASRLPPPERNRDPERRLRIAYVSSDFRDHPNRWFMNAIFEHRDPRVASVGCYSSLRRPDRETAWIRDRVDDWREVTEMSDAAIAALLRADQVDIAVYLGGRFDGNRPLVASYRPAPVQVSYLDGGTSGITGMDYWITDGILHPEGQTKERFTEQLVRLPVFYSFTRPMPDLPQGPLPALANGGVTFGSFAQPSRVTDEVIAVWAEILAAVPGSRLRLKSRNRYGDSANRHRLLHGFDRRGVDPGRIAIDAVNDSHIDHLARYGSVDVALDTFPFSGATTTFEALWMGVPVITMPGSRFVARMAAAIVGTVGHPELIAGSSEAYVATAVTLAQDLDRMGRLRERLRRDVASSPLCDGPAYARSMDEAYRSMWRKWCAQPRVEPS